MTMTMPMVTQLKRVIAKVTAITIDSSIIETATKTCDAGNRGNARGSDRDRDRETMPKTVMTIEIGIDNSV